MTRTITLLWAEDDPIIRAIIDSTLGSQPGIDLRLYDSGEALISAARDCRADLVALDVIMPQMDGPEVLSSLRQMDATRSVPIAFVTAESDPRKMQELLDLGAVGIINKPIDIRTLPGRIRDFSEKASYANIARTIPRGRRDDVDLTQIRGQYVTSVLERAEIIRRDSMHLFANVDGVAALASIRLQAHTIAGSAKTFGYAAIGDAARDLEFVAIAMASSHLLNAADQPQLVEKLSRLFERIRELQQQTVTPS